jgi:chromosomal replication initiation ATPase DnaA
MVEGQFPIPFPHTPRFTEGGFLPGAGNQLALDFLANTESWPQGRLALWGVRGSGKTHLLHIWARNHGAGMIEGARLRRPVWPEGPIGVDDIDRVRSPSALLHLMNAAAEAGHKLLLTSRAAPGRLPVRLPDLASRLRATTAVEIDAADDAFLATLLEAQLGERQLRVDPAVRAWILTRIPRTPGAIQDAVDRLDRANLAAKSAVTRPLAARALADLLQGDLVAPPA